MLRVLMASQPIRAGWVASTTFSTVTHGALIAIAVATNHAVSAVHESRAAERTERVTYVEPARLAEALREARAAKRAEAARAKAAAEQRKRKEAFEALTQLLDFKIDVPLQTMPALDVEAAPIALESDFVAPTMTLAQALGAKNGVVTSTSGVFTEDMVERSVQARRGNPKPRYPSSLANTGVEGAFIVRFVVDSVGEVAADRIEFPNTMHRLFASAVKVALLKSHYAPAMIAGRFVSQQVVQEFRFEIGRR